jgi:hypothetical protein
MSDCEREILVEKKIRSARPTVPVESAPGASTPVAQRTKFRDQAGTQLTDIIATVRPSARRR